MVSPEAENEDHCDDGIRKRDAPIGSELIYNKCPNDGDNRAAVDRSQKSCTNSSNSSNSSISGIDSYNADCSGGSDDQSSDDTSGNKKVKHAIMSNVASFFQKFNDGIHNGSASNNSISSCSRLSEAALHSHSVSKKHDMTLFSKTVIEPADARLPFQKSTINPKSTGSSNMDTQIDLSIVNAIPSNSLLVPLHATAKAALLQCSSVPHARETDSSNLHPASFFSPEGYHNLLEAVRPFFQAQGILLSQELHNSSNTSNELKSNLHSLSRNEGSRADESVLKNSSSDGFTSFFTTTDDSRNQASHLANRTAVKEHDPDCSQLDMSSSDDFSSMAVLTQSKRKLSISKQHPKSLPSSSSISNEHQIDLVHSHGNRRHELSHKVTDISSNPSNTASGSGSGDTEANTGSGTGSNNGSSASGNENAKNSSEELAKEDSNSGDGTNISDGSAAHREANHRHDPGYFAYAEGQRETAFLLPENNEIPTEKDGKINAISSSTREQKILDKKRKRIVMRREYEAQQHGSATSSECSCDPIGNFFPPGHPLTLDEVLVFSNFPRIIVQGTEPYFIVHKNAACCRVTGIDAHEVVGKPLHTILLLPDDSQNEVMGNLTKSKNEQCIPEMNTSNCNTSNCNIAFINDIIATCGSGKVHIVQLNTRILNSMSSENNILQDKNLRLNEVNEEINDTSITSISDCKKTFTPDRIEKPRIFCQLSIAPIVSLPEHFEKKDGTKRIKYCFNLNDTAPLKHDTKQLLPTHYILQLEVCNSKFDICESEELNEKISTASFSTNLQNVNEESNDLSSQNSNEKNAVFVIG